MDVGVMEVKVSGPKGKDIERKGISSGVAVEVGTFDCSYRLHVGPDGSFFLDVLDRDGQFVERVAAG